MVGDAGMSPGAVVGGRGGGVSRIDLTGYATESWVNENYLSIGFFSSLFKAYDSASTPNEIVPNGGDTSAITNIKAMFGFWTEQYLSALGQGSGGGGGGGGGTVTSVNTGTGLTGGPITGSGTISISSTYQTLIGHGETAYGWGNHAQAGYSTPSSVAAQMQSYCYISGGVIHIGDNSITPITGVTGTFWGRSWSAGGSVTGSMAGVGSISMDGTINGVQAIELNNDTSTHGTTHGGHIDFHFNGSQDDYTSRIIENAIGQLNINGVALKSNYVVATRLCLTDSIYFVLDSNNNVHLVGAGFYTDSFVSALGLDSSGGGGGGGSSTLAGLLDVQFGTLAANDVLTYDGSGHWKNTPKATLLSGYATQSWVTGTALSGYATRSWVGQQGFLTSVAFGDLTSHPSTLSGYGITDAIGSGTTFWGRSVNNGSVSGNMSGVGSIEMSNLLYMANGMSIQFKDNGGTYRNVLTFNASNQLAIGYHVRQQGYATDIQGGTITFAVGTTRVDALEINGTGRVYVRQGTQGLRIGDGLITWDSTNNALKISDAWGNTANLYALGGVSALNFASGSGSAIVNNLTVDGSIQMKDYNNTPLKAVSVTLAESSTTTNYLNIGEAWKTLYHDTRIYGHNIQLISGNGSYVLYMNGSGKVVCPNNLQANRFYLDSSRYLYLNGSSLYYYNGSTSVQIA